MRTCPPLKKTFSAQRWRVRCRPHSLPPCWRAIAAMEQPEGYIRFRDGLLVLNARNIPHKTTAWRGQKRIYVPPLFEGMARRELGEYRAERCRPASVPSPLPVFGHAYLAALVFLPLILWHGWRTGWWPAPDILPPPDIWARSGVLDTILVRVFGQWHRLLTALTLHASVTHLWGNVAFGALFLPLLARLTGVGRALWLSLLGGVWGNAATVLLRPTPVKSMGFSTALFASVGIMAGFMACQERQRRKAMLPVAAAAALLAMLGTEGENTDYAAHIAGLGCGLVLGALEAWRVRKGWSGLGQIAAALLATAMPLAAWWWAFNAVRG